MATNNSINARSTGLQRYNGSGTFDAVTTTQYNTLVGDTSNGIANISPGSSGQVLTSNGASANPSYQAAPGVFAPNSTIVLSDDFVSFTTLTGLGGTPSEVGWVQQNFSRSNFTQVSTNPGIIGNASFTTAGQASINLGTSTTGGFVLGGGAITLNWVFKIATLSNSTNRYLLYIGFGNLPDGEPTSGCYILYSDNVNSGNWQFKTANAGTRTSSNSSVAANTSFHNLQITINAAATSVAFAIDGVSLGTALTTNIPTGQITPSFIAVQSAGTIAQGSLGIDLMYLTQTLTASR